MCFSLDNYPVYGSLCTNDSDCKECDALSNSFCVQFLCVLGSCRLCDYRTTFAFNCTFGTDSGQHRECIAPGVWSTGSR